MDFLKETISHILSSPTTALLAVSIALFLLLTFKSLPLIWHVRVLSAFIQHPKHHHTFKPTTTTPRVFQPLTTSTRCSIPEIDYSFHKSNSTYFSDLDISRVHLLLSLFRSGVARLQDEDETPLGQGKGKPEQGGGKVMPVLGGVSANFRRAIKPWGKYEIVTRVLGWDEKWIYIGSWFVVPGALGRHMREKKNFRASSSSGGEDESNIDRKEKAQRSEEMMISKCIYASAMAKYVIKAGKVTVPPERLLVASGLLPVGDGQEVREVRRQIEERRLRGLEYAREPFGLVDGALLGELAGGGDDETLGFFRDLI